MTDTKMTQSGIIDTPHKDDTQLSARGIIDTPHKEDTTQWSIIETLYKDDT